MWLEKIIPSVRLRAWTDPRAPDVREREILCCCTSADTPLFLVVISQAQLLLNLFLGTIQSHIGDFIWS